MKNGSVSTFQLGQLGYDQPPRAAQDLKEFGVRLRVTFAKHPKTRNRMAIYWLADDQPFLEGTFRGRQAFSKEFRRKILEECDSKCLFCASLVEKSRLQIDHRVPYQIAGEVNVQNVIEFMLLCSSHQRIKSWTCEHCPAYAQKNALLCKSCFWAIPDGDFTHVATVPERRLDLLWKGEQEVRAFEALKARAQKENIPLADYLKKMAMK